MAGVPGNLYRVWLEFLQICTTNERVWPEFLQICTTNERVWLDFLQICTTTERVQPEFWQIWTECGRTDEMCKGSKAILTLDRCRQMKLRSETEQVMSTRGGTMITLVHQLEREN